MCTSDREFKIDGRQDCFRRGYDRTGFFEGSSPTRRIPPPLEPIRAARFVPRQETRPCQPRTNWIGSQTVCAM